VHKSSYIFGSHLEAIRVLFAHKQSPIEVQFRLKGVSKQEAHHSISPSAVEARVSRMQYTSKVYLRPFR